MIATKRLISWRHAAAAALILLAVPGVSHGQEVECRLAPNGSITTWLVAPPYPLDPKAGFSKDLLPEKTGETSGLRRAEGAGPVKWRGEAFNRSFVDLSKRCLKRGESVFYTACELRAEKAGTYILDATYWSQISVWLDGKPVLKGVVGKDDTLIARKSAKVKLVLGRTHHLLVKLGSRRRQALLRLALLSDRGGKGLEPAPAPVRCVLRVPAERVGGVLAGSLTVFSNSRSIVRANKLVVMSVQAPVGCPILKGEIALKALMLDHEGRAVKQFKNAKIEAEDLLRDGPPGAIPLPWRVPKNLKARRYTFRADILYAGKKAGELAKEFYLADGLSVWAQSLNKRIQKVQLQLGARRYTVPDFALARLKHEKAVLYSRGDAFGGFSPEDLVKELDGCERAVTRLEKKRKRPVKRGLAEHAYLSVIDDSPQPYYIHVPRGHDGRTLLPCIVYLHGYSPDLNKLNWEMIPRELLDYCDRHGYYLVAPFARSNTDFQAVGEADVRRVLLLFAARYPIDASRLFLLGYSMGAMGAFTIGAHYPDLWAGIVSVSGRADYYMWQGLDRNKVEPYKRQLIDMEFGAQMIGNYKTVPILMYHGGNDTLIKVEQSRSILKRLAPLGADVTLRELPGEDHWIMSNVLADDAIFKWMAGAKRKRNRWAPEVDFTTYTIKYRRSHWVTVVDMVRWGEPIKVHAKLSADKSAVDVRTQNVATLRLDLLKELIGDPRKVTVRINGKQQVVDAPGQRTFEVEQTNRVGKLRKTPQLCGPIKEAYNRRFIVVIGGERGKKVDRAADMKRLKEQVRIAASEWYEFAKAMPLIKLDTRIGAADVARANLVLYGKPSNNTKLSEVADKLPIRVTDQGFVFPAVGEKPAKTYSNKDHGLVMIYPNPLNPARYVVVRSGLPYGGRRSPNHKFDLLPDFIIFKEGTDYDDTNSAVVAGFFDENWRLAERLIWRRGKEPPDPRINPLAAPEMRLPAGIRP